MSEEQTNNNPLWTIPVHLLDMILKNLDYNSLEALARTSGESRQLVQCFKRENPDHIDKIMASHNIVHDDKKQSQRVTDHSDGIK